MLNKIKENSLLKTAVFAVRHAFRAGKGYWLTLVAAYTVSALITPLSALLVGKLASTIKAITSDNTSTLTPLIPWMLVAAAISLVFALCKVAIQHSSLCLMDRLTLKMQHQVIEHITSLNLELIEDRNIQDVLERAQTNPGLFLTKFLTGILDVIAAMIRIVGLIGVIFWISPVWAAAIALLCIPALAGNRYLSYIQFNLKRNKTKARRWGHYYSTTLANRDTIPSTITLGVIPLFLQRFRETVLDINEANLKFYRVRTWITLGVALMAITVLTVALLTIAKGVLAGTLSVGKFTAFLMSTWRMQVSLAGLGKSFFDISESEFNIFNIRELFSLQNTLPPGGTQPLKDPCGKLEVRNLSFTYQGTDRPVLKNISLTIERGETVAIVGANGSGKTTLAKLIAQLYPPTEGTILLDELPMQEYDRKALYKATSFVTQYPVQFEATVGENIAFGDWENLNHSPEKIQAIAKQAQIDSAIQNMPQGYDTQLGRLFGTYDISGGQRQKLALARALACTPSILILDEPTAALDIHTEYELYTNIRETVHNKTTILISHRFSTVRMADRIFVLNEGNLVESGSHEELTAKNGTYAVMFKMYEEMGASKTN